MCGFVGFLDQNLTRRSLEQATRLLTHRGPDNEGIYYHEGIGLGHRRLSIIDLDPRSNQPMEYEDLLIVFNGELYNYKDIRSKLSSKGYRFKTNGDTEVILKAFHCFGAKAVEEFNGMFAFAIVNKRSHEFYIFRDRAGIKPCYYSLNEKGIHFASEIKSLRLLRDYAINSNQVAHFFKFGYTGISDSIFDGITKLEPAQFVHLKDGKLRKHKYWDPFKHENPEYQDDLTDSYDEELESLLKDSIQYRLNSDVPVALLLSGGVDSSLLAALLGENANIESFTVGFDEEEFDESSYSSSVSEELGIKKNIQLLGKDQMQEVIPNFFDLIDEPFSDASLIPTYFVMKCAKEQGYKVVLSGDGADEIFGGYSRYVQAYGYWKLMKKQPGLTSAIHHLLGKSSRLWEGVDQNNMEHRLTRIYDYTDYKQPSQFYAYLMNNLTTKELKKNDFSLELWGTEEDNGLSSIRDFQWLDYSNYLPSDILQKVDAASMYNSIEARIPYLDHRIIEFIFQKPDKYLFDNREGKQPLRRILSRYISSKSTQRPKQGFNIPLFKWFESKDLRELLFEMISSERIAHLPAINATEINKNVRLFRKFQVKGREYNMERIWRIFVYSLWCQKHYGI